MGILWIVRIWARHTNLLISYVIYWFTIFHNKRLRLSTPFDPRWHRFRALCDLAECEDGSKETVNDNNVMTKIGRKKRRKIDTIEGHSAILIWMGMKTDIVFWATHVPSSSVVVFFDMPSTSNLRFHVKSVDSLVWSVPRNVNVAIE